MVVDVRSTGLDAPRDIGESLHAGFLLETTRRHGARVRITARLVETATEVHRWSETLSHRRLSDVGAGGRGQFRGARIAERVPPE